jgi:2-polyprenyl-3-methyl-5-hydroxy-6-metoxy-1,4-benzoquinol methylase
MATPLQSLDTSRSRVVAKEPSATGRDSPIRDQTDYWTAWNASYVGTQRGAISQRQAQIIGRWLVDLKRTDMRILEVGCGTGWMVDRMRPFGEVAGTDLSEAVLAVAQQSIPGARFIAGDFMTSDWPGKHYDVVVTMEVLSHVSNQEAFLERIADVLKPGGTLMLTTQNRPVLERCEDVAPRAEGQIRNWVDRHGLRGLLARRFRIDAMFSIWPHGHLGFLRVVNSVKLNRLVGSVIPQAKLDAAKERLWLGHTLMVKATVAR